MNRCTRALFLFRTSQRRGAPHLPTGQRDVHTPQTPKLPNSPTPQNPKTLRPTLPTGQRDVLTPPQAHQIPARGRGDRAQRPRLQAAHPRDAVRLDASHCPFRGREDVWGLSDFTRRTHAPPRGTHHVLSGDCAACMPLPRPCRAARHDKDAAPGPRKFSLACPDPKSPNGEGDVDAPSATKSKGTVRHSGSGWPFRLG